MYFIIVPSTDTAQADEWKGRLSKPKREILDTFFSRCSTIVETLTELLPFVALSAPLKLCTLKRVYEISCEPVRSHLIANTRNAAYVL